MAESTSFQGLDLIEPLQRALRDEGYTNPTQIQAEAIPPILMGKDIIGCAQTGTGKTAAFALPIMQLLAEKKMHVRPRRARVLVLTPTRELAAQIGESFRTYGRYLHQSQAIVYGGVKQGRQVNKMARGVDVLIATPGRLLDLMDQGHIKLGGVEIFVLDEADRMLDMGFIRDIRKVIAVLPRKRQTLLFSATMPKEIVSLADSILADPVKISVAPESPTVDLVDQKVMFVDGNKKIQLLKAIMADYGTQRTLIFTRTKHMADRVALTLSKANIQAQAIHGNKSQTGRTHALNSFRSGRTPVLVATDIAARGIDVDDISHVINYEIPDEPETYVHRIGRTARAGASGTAISFCEAQERNCVRDIEQFIKKEITVVDDHPFHSRTAKNATGKAAKRPPRGQRRPPNQADIPKKRYRPHDKMPKKRQTRRRRPPKYKT